LPSSFSFTKPHSQLGYSSSFIASGSCFPFIKFNPLNGVPAGTDDNTKAGGVDFLATGFASVGGVEPALKGCAAEVDVAAGGWCVALGEPCLGAVVVAAVGETAWEGRGGADVKVLERMAEFVLVREAQRRQRLQIMICLRDSFVECGLGSIVCGRRLEPRLFCSVGA